MKRLLNYWGVPARWRTEPVEVRWRALRCKLLELPQKGFSLQSLT